MIGKRHGRAHFKVMRVYPVPPHWAGARNEVPLTAVRNVGVKMTKSEAWQAVKALSRFLLSRDNFVEIKGERGTNSVSISSRLEE